MAAFASQQISWRREILDYLPAPDSMDYSNLILRLVAGLVLARLATELWLNWLNQRHVIAHADEVPAAFREAVDAATYAKSVNYTLAKGRFGQVTDACNATVQFVILCSGVLPWAFHFFTNHLGTSAWAAAAMLFAVGLVMSLPGLPFEWFEQFRLEERFGFNTTTQTTWWLDRLKGLLLAMVLGYPLLVLILKCVEWTGGHWWLWAWAALLVFQCLMMVLAPVLILPLFNKISTSNG